LARFEATSDSRLLDDKHRKVISQLMVFALENEVDSAKSLLENENPLQDEIELKIDYLKKLVDAKKDCLMSEQVPLLLRKLIRID